ncbi:MAG: winged helix-turn-helix domain-containing protein [Nanoarchaeota archaeon]
MNFDEFFSSSKWQILEMIAREPASPIQIAKKIGTSVAYVSQQLKLLEAAGIVIKKRTGAAEKGKPRTIYSIAREVVNFTVLANKFPVKGRVFPSEHQKTVLRIWSLENSELHYLLEKMYWKLEPHLSKIDGLFVDVKSKKPGVVVFSKDKKLKQKIDLLIKETSLELEFLQDFEEGKRDLHAIYVPNLSLIESGGDANEN